MVEAMRFAMGEPPIFTGAVSVSEVKTATSVRPEASRWSSVSQSRPGQAVVVAHGLAGARAIGNRLRGIGDVLVERGLVRGGRREADRVRCRVQVEPGCGLRAREPHRAPAVQTIGHDGSFCQTLAPDS